MLLALIACSADETIDCDTSAAVSVSVTVVGPEDPTVTMITDAGEFACDDWPDGTWACGYEVAGDVTVRAAADGWVTTQKTVTVEQGECHVVGESVTLEMDEVACSTEALPSVLVTVTGAGGEELAGEAVSWMPADGTGEPTPCDGADADWVCGEEEAGDFVVYAVADGHAEERQGVTVPLTDDGCHVVPQQLAFELDWLPD
ncbi:MAG: hypothetical protein ACOZNI_37500 [Myxococcota bacterium]